MTSEETAIAAVLRQYEAAANASDAAAVAQLYAHDGVLMAQESPSCVGAAAIRAAYEGMFGAIALSIRFEIAEIRQLAPDWAFLRSTSSGTITLKAAGQSVPEGNQELFVFQKVDGTWKIARYCFSTTSPAGA